MHGQRNINIPSINSSCLCQAACPSVRKNSTAAGKFSWNMILRSFTKICTEDSFWLKSDRNNRHCTRDQHTFINIVLTDVTMFVIITKVSSVSVVTLPLLFMLPLILSLPWLSVLSDCYGYASAPNAVQSSDVSCVIFILFFPQKLIVVIKCRDVDCINSRLFRMNKTSRGKTAIELGRIIKHCFGSSSF